MRSNTMVESLFLINPNVPATELHNAVHERLTKIKAITNYMLADCSDGDPSVSSASKCDALWLIEGLADEADQLMVQTHQSTELKAAIHPKATSTASEKNSPLCLFENCESLKQQSIY